MFPRIFFVAYSRMDMYEYYITEIIEIFIQKTQKFNILLVYYVQKSNCIQVVYKL